MIPQNKKIWQTYFSYVIGLVWGLKKNKNIFFLSFEKKKLPALFKSLVKVIIFFLDLCFYKLKFALKPQKSLIASSKISASVIFRAFCFIASALVGGVAADFRALLWLLKSRYKERNFKKTIKNWENLLFKGLVSGF